MAQIIHHLDGNPRNNAISNLEIRPMPTIFDRLRSAFRPAPILPNITNDQYKSEREAVNVLRSMGRVVQIGPHRFTVTAEDWGDVKSCEVAASRCAVILAREGYTFKDQPITEVLDAIADRIMGELRIPADRMLGCCFIVEPL